MAPALDPHNANNKGLMMLVLERLCGEKITIGDDITITLIRAANGKERIGIQAPEKLPILRTEAVKKTKSSQSGETSPASR